MTAELVADTTSDSALAESVAATVARPKKGVTNSFTLHAPLEAAARAALLPMVAGPRREAARKRLLSIAGRYVAAGEDAGEPPARAYESVGAGVEGLCSEIASGDVDGADCSAAWLADHAGAHELVGALAPLMVPGLAAAAHGNIWLDQARRGRSAGRSGRRALRAIARGFAATPDWTLTWHGGLKAGPAATSAALTAALAGPRNPGDPGSDFIFPLMHATEESGLAAEVLTDAVAGVPIDEGERALLRVAAAAMLQDDEAAAPYGWSHCLTIPQGVLGIGRTLVRQQDAVAVAATLVLGFRSIQGRVTLNEAWEPERIADPLGAVEGSAAQAGAAAWWASDEEAALLWTELASRAACHPDAHLAKYTLACRDAEQSDPGARRLYLAAAAHLHGWWNGTETGTYT